MGNKSIAFEEDFRGEFDLLFLATLALQFQIFSNR